MTLVALRQDLAEVRVSCVILDEHRERRRLARDIRDVLEPLSLERELAADDDADPVLRRFLTRANDAVEAVAIGDRDRVVAELRRAKHHVLGRRGAREEAEVRPGGQLDVAPLPFAIVRRRSASSFSDT